MSVVTVVVPSDTQSSISVCKCGGGGIVHFVLKFCLASCQKVNFSVVRRTKNNFRKGLIFYSYLD